MLNKKLSKMVTSVCTATLLMSGCGLFSNLRSVDLSEVEEYLEESGVSKEIKGLGGRIEPNLTIEYLEIGDDPDTPERRQEKFNSTMEENESFVKEHEDSFEIDYDVDLDMIVMTPVGKELLNNIDNLLDFSDGDDPWEVLFWNKVPEVSMVIGDGITPTTAVGVVNPASTERFLYIKRINDVVYNYFWDDNPELDNTNRYIDYEIREIKRSF